MIAGDFALLLVLREFEAGSLSHCWNTHGWPSGGLEDVGCGAALGARQKFGNDGQLGLAVAALGLPLRLASFFGASRRLALAGEHLVEIGFALGLRRNKSNRSEYRHLALIL